MSVADHFQRADHIAHLMMKKRTCFRIKENVFSFLPDVEPVERFERRFGLTFDRAEGSEVMMSEEISRAFAHFIDIQRNHYRPAAVFVNDKRRPAVGDAVNISASDGRIAGVKVRCRFFRRQHRDRCFHTAEMSVYRLAQAKRVNFAV